MVFFPDHTTAIRGVPWLVAGAPRLVVGTPYLVGGAPRCSHYKSFNCPGNGAMPLLSWHALQSPIPGFYPRRWHQNCLVLATGPGNRPVVRVWTAITGRFDSKPGQKPDPLTLGRPNPDPYPSTRGFRRVWLDPSGPISGSAFRVSHLGSHSDMLLLIVK